MPYKNPEDHKKWGKRYYKENQSIWKNSDGSWIMSYKDNPTKGKEVAKKSYLKHRDKILTKRKARDKSIKLSWYHKVSPEEIKNLFTKFDNKCAICDSTENLCVDHNYTSLKLRGILCKACNLFIGHAYERVELLQRGINYLIKYGTKHDK